MELVHLNVLFMLDTAHCLWYIERISDNGRWPT